VDEEGFAAAAVWDEGGRLAGNSLAGVPAWILIGLPSRSRNDELP
jgi:hypothetical protein